MALKKVSPIEEIEDIKRSLDFLGEEVSAVRLQQKNILDLVEEVKELRLQNLEKEKRIVFLENRVADLVQYTDLPHTRSVVDKKSIGETASVL